MFNVFVSKSKFERIVSEIKMYVLRVIVNDDRFKDNNMMIGKFDDSTKSCVNPFIVKKVVLS